MVRKVSKMENENTFDIDKVNSTKSYVFFLLGQLVSLLGTAIVQFTLIWWITITSQDNPALENYTGLILGIAAFVGFGPMVFTYVFSGVLVDRWNRQKTILWTNIIEAFLSVVLMVLFFTHQATIPIVLLILTIKGVVQGFLNPTIQAIVPLLVPRDKLTRINSFENLGISYVNLVGPVIGAVVIGYFGLGEMDLVLLIDSLSFLVVLIPTIMIKIPVLTKKSSTNEKPSFKSEFVEGFSFIRNTKGLLALLTTFTMINILTTPINTLLPIVVIGTFTPDSKLGPVILSLAFVFTQIGSLGTSFFLTKFKIFEKNVLGVVSGQTLIYISYFIFIISLAFTNTTILYFAMVLEGCSIILANVHSQTIWQSVVPPELQGRVMSIRMVIAWVMIPFSMLVSGFLSDIIGYYTLFVICAVLGSFYLLFAWFFTGLPNVEEDLGLIEKKYDPDIHPLTEETSKLI